MKKLLHIIATPRGEESRTLKVSRAFLHAFAAGHPYWVVEELDLFKEELPPLSAKRVDGKYMLLEGQDLYGSLREAWGDIIAQIERFLSADGYVISTPMWNYSVPYVLKQYIDIIIQPKYMFRDTEHGSEGMARGRRMVVVNTCGGTYASESARHRDFVEPYLRTAFRLAGIEDITFVRAAGMDSSEEDAKQRALAAAQEQARVVARDWPAG